MIGSSIMQSSDEYDWVDKWHDAMGNLVYVQRTCPDCESPFEGVDGEYVTCLECGWTNEPYGVV